jgi:putative endonuclease
VYFVYVLRCKDGTYYTGSTTDVAARLSCHEAGRGAKYTRGRAPFRLVYVEAFLTRGEALRREADVKRLSRRRKEELIGRSCPLSHADRQS